MTQSDEESCSHQSLASNIAAMYALSGKQTAPALGYKTVRRDDVSIGVVNVDNVLSCPTCDRMASSISERSSKSKTAHGIPDFRDMQFVILQKRGYVLQGSGNQ